MCLNITDQGHNWTKSPPSRRSLVVVDLDTLSGAYEPYIYDPFKSSPTPESQNRSSTAAPSINLLRGFGQKVRRVGKVIKERGEQLLHTAAVTGDSSREGPPRLIFQHRGRLPKGRDTGSIFGRLEDVVDGMSDRDTASRPVSNVVSEKGGRWFETETKGETKAEMVLGFKAFPGGTAASSPPPYPDSPDDYTHLGIPADGTQLRPSELPQDNTTRRSAVIGVEEAEEKYREMLSPSPHTLANAAGSGRPSRGLARYRGLSSAVRAVVPAAADGRAPYPSPTFPSPFAMPGILRPLPTPLAYEIPPRGESLGRTRALSMHVDAPSMRGDRFDLHFDLGLVLASESTVSLPSRVLINELEADACLIAEKAMKRRSRSQPDLKLDFDIDVQKLSSTPGDKSDSTSRPCVAEDGDIEEGEEVSISELEVKAQKLKNRISSGVLPNQTPFTEVVQAATRQALLVTVPEMQSWDMGSPVSPLQEELEAGPRCFPALTVSQFDESTPQKQSESRTVMPQALRRVKAVQVDLRSLARPIPQGESRITGLTTTPTTGSLLDVPIPSSIRSRDMMSVPVVQDNGKESSSWSWSRFVDTSYEDPAVAHSQRFRDKKVWAKNNSGMLIEFAGTESEKEEKRKSLMSLMKGKNVEDLLNFFEGRKPNDDNAKHD